jgi:apolipoprotein N-acyltransferase
VTIAQERNYYDQIVDAGTPAEKARSLTPELASLEDRLFAESEKVVTAGAKVIFWSEVNAVLLPEHKDDFLRRARAFAQAHQVYLAPAYLVLRYGETTGDNQVTMIQPDGNVAYTYTKTKSWYATDSDGILRFVDTPFGRISTAICFDMDFPELIRQAARQNVDIMLVPAFDSYGIRTYHTEVGLMRAVEYGFSVVRQVNEGISMAADYQGRVLAYQDFYRTSDRVMIADVPIRGTHTLYGRLGDWLAYLCCAMAIAAIVATAVWKVAGPIRSPRHEDSPTGSGG